jgi:hypothetical protein
MKGNHLRSIWTLLYLWAAVAMLMPSLLWACPMNGRIGNDPGQVCPCVSRLKTHSSHLAGEPKCCHRVPVPASDTSGDGTKVTSLLPSQNLKLNPASLPHHQSPRLIHLANLVLFEKFVVPFQATVLPTASPPGAFARHFSASFSGRAPPR